MSLKTIIGSLRVNLGLDSAEFQEGLTKSSKKLKDFGAAAASIMAAGAAAMGAATALYIRNSMEAERAQKQLEAVLKSTNQAAGLNAKQLQDLASEMQSFTTYGDEAVMGAESLLLTFTRIGKDAFPQALEATLDVATALGTDLKSAALQVGKALNDPVAGLTALTRSGITFSDEQKTLIKHLVETNRLGDAQVVMLKELQNQFGGSAAAARDTLGGAMVALQNAFGDLFEVGTGATDGIKDNIEELTAKLTADDTREAFQTFGNWLIAGLNAGVTAAVSLINTVDTVIDKFRSIDQRTKLKPLQEETAYVVNRIASLKEALKKAQSEDWGLGNFVRQWGVGNAEEQIAELEKRADALYERQKELLSDSLYSGDSSSGQSVVPTIPDLNLPTFSLPGSGGGSDSFKKLMDEGRRIFEQTRTEAERFSAEMAHLNELLAAGAIDQDTYNRAVKDAQDAFKGADVAGKAFASTVNDAMGKAGSGIRGLIDHTRELGDVVWDVAGAFGQFALQGLAATGPLGALASSFLGGLFGFANGGYGVAGGVGGIDSQVFAAKVTPGEPFAFGDAAMVGINAMEGGAVGSSRVVVNQSFTFAGVTTKEDVQRMAAAAGGQAVESVKRAFPGWQAELQTNGAIG